MAVSLLLTVLLWHATVLLVSHIVITKLGMLLIEVEVIQSSNRFLQANEKEKGFLILDAANQDILFSSKMAKKW